MKTTVTEFLDSKGIEYVVKPHSKEVFTCEEAAKERGIRLSQIVKCMVGRGPDGRLHVMMVPGDRTLKLKRVRQVAGGIRIELVPMDELAGLEGVTVGAISPTQFIGKAAFYIDNHIFNEEDVTISSGSPMAGIELKAAELAKLLDAIKCDIISTSQGVE